MAEALEESRQSLAHTGHSEACASDPRTLWLGRTLALGLKGHGWHGRRGRAAPGPAERQQDEEPEESQQSELVVQQV